MKHPGLEEKSMLQRDTGLGIGCSKMGKTLNCFSGEGMSLFYLLAIFDG